jgi:DNA-binding NarL/FixJ family response regulator
MGSQRVAVEVFLLAENRLLRETLVRFLAKSGEILVVGSGSYSLAIHRQIIASHPSVVLLDSSGFDLFAAKVIPTLQASVTDLRVVMIDMDMDEATFLRAVREGVAGYILKDASVADVATTVKAVASGQAVCPPSLSMALFRSVAEQAAPSPAIFWGTEHGLSRREQQLVQLLSQRLTNKEIAMRLNLAEQTVKNHVHSILRKVGAENRSGIVERYELQRFGTSS